MAEAPGAITPAGISLSRLLTRLIWLCVLPLVLLSAYVAYERVQGVQEGNRTQATSLALSAAASADQTLRGRIRGLAMLASGEHIHSANGMADLYADAKAFGAQFGVNVVLADSRLRMVFNTRVPLGTPMPPLPMPKGRAAAPSALASGKPEVGDVFMGPISHTQLVAVAYPATVESDVKFILLATFEASTFRERLQSAGLPKGWTLALRDSTGAVIASHGGPVAEAGATDAVKRFTAPLTLAPWSMEVQIPRALYTAPAMASASSLLIGILAATLVSVFAGTLAGGRLRRAVMALLAHNGGGKIAYDISEIGEVRRRLQESAEQRRRAEAARNQSEAQLDAAFEQAAVGMAMVGPEGRFLRVNQKLCEILGYAREELLVRDFQRITHPEDLAAGIDQVKRLVAGEISDFTQEKRYLRKDGTSLWAVVTVAAVRGPDGSLDHQIAVVADIQARKDAEAALQQSEIRFHAMLEQSIAAVYVIQDGRLAYVNARTREIFGYGPDEEFDPDPLAHVAPEDRERVAEQIRLRMQTGEPAEYRVASLRKDGSRFLLGVSARRAMLSGRWAIIAVAQDVTEKARADEEIARHLAELERTIRSSVEVVSRIGAIRDPYTHGHERRVGEFASALAAEMGLPARDVEGARIAGHMHDVGNISVPAEILSKSRKLAPAEMDLVRQHPEQGYEILKALQFPWPVAEVALQHHERLDGSGYPRGLKGDEIDPLARIVAVADVVEAMSSHRPFRASLGLDAALAEVEQGRGTLYDAKVVDACLRLFREKGYRLPE